MSNGMIETDAGVIGQISSQSMTASIAVQLAAAMVDKRIATAKAYPRTIAGFKAEATGLLTEDVTTARMAEYAKPVGGGTVKGPSIRMAEILLLCWRNLDIEIHAPEIGDKFVTARAVAHDLERNIRMEGLSVMAIVDKTGARYKPSMIETICLAAAAKARRNAIFNIIPRAYVSSMLEVARSVAEKHEKPLGQRREEMLSYFERSHKVNREQIFALCDVKGADDLTAEHLADLRTIATSIKDGEATVDEFFQPQTSKKTDAVKERLAARKETKTEDTATPKNRFAYCKTLGELEAATQEAVGMSESSEVPAIEADYQSRKAELRGA